MVLFQYILEPKAFSQIPAVTSDKLPDILCLSSLTYETGIAIASP